MTLGKSTRLLPLIAVGLAACQAASPPCTPPPVAPPPALAFSSSPSESAALPPPAPSAAPVLDPPASQPASPAPAPSSTPRTPEPPAVCGRKPGERIERVPWGHGSGNARCDALETLWANVPHADRACRSDDECTVVVSDGNCIRLPLTKAAARRIEYKTPPCGNPMSGACPADRLAPRCANGCCVAR